MGLDDVAEVTGVRAWELLQESSYLLHFLLYDEAISSSLKFQLFLLF